MTIADHINIVRQEIRDVCAKHHINHNNIKLLAVSKTHSARSIRSAFEQGIRSFGESYLQESLTKIDALKDIDIDWHFIGPIQSNKTKPIAEHFDWVQSIDRVKLLTRFSQQRSADLPPLNVCIQLNFFNESQKKGATKEQSLELLEIAEKLPNIRLRGLMAIPPRVTQYQKQLEQFNEIASFFHKIKDRFVQMDTLSIGMSGDLEAAIVAGSNMLRIGTAIFGTRQNIQKA